MIQVTRLSGQQVYVNADHILFLESSPETIITLQNGKKVTIKESIPEVIESVIQYKTRCFPMLADKK
jgi:flagellar protein FlbD